LEVITTLEPGDSTTGPFATLATVPQATTVDVAGTCTITKGNIGGISNNITDPSVIPSGFRCPPPSS